MCFGAAKTQLVIFTTRQTPLTSPYESLTLCGFTISLASEYKCDASDRVRGKTQVVHRRAAQVYMCSGEEWNGMNEEEER